MRLAITLHAKSERHLLKVTGMMSITLMVIIKAILLVRMTAQINNHSEVMGAALDTSASKVTANKRTFRYL